MMGFFFDTYSLYAVVIYMMVTYSDHIAKNVTMLGGNMKKKIMNLEEKVYLLMYGKPDYIANISRIIYKKRCKTIDRVVKKLKGDGWIKEIKYEPLREPLDARMSKGTYYSANMKPLFDSILRDLEEKNISLTSKEKESLKRYLDSKSFRATVREITVEDGKLRSKNIDFSTVKRNLCYLSTYMIFIIHWTDGRAFRVPLADSVWERVTHPISSLGLSLCEKLISLDLHTSFLALSSFEDVQVLIEGSFNQVFKDDIPSIKLDGDTRKKLLKKSKRQAFVWVDPDKGVRFKIIEKKGND